MIPDSKPFLEPENSLNVLEFLRVAHEYCHFIEISGEKEKPEIYEFLLKLIPLVYLKGKLLPDIQPDNPESSERYVTEEEWQEIFNTCRAVFGQEDEYYHVGYEDYNEYEAVKASLAENLTDSYQDLKDFVLLYQKNSQAARQNAVHDCSALLEARWGPKLLSVMRYLHYLSNKKLLSSLENELE
jgi:hypothetical protein